MNPWYRALSLWNVTTGALRDIRGVRPVVRVLAVWLVASGYGFAAMADPVTPWGIRFGAGILVGAIFAAIASFVVSIVKAEP